MKKNDTHEDAALREALHELAEQGVPAADVQGAVRRKLREASTPAHSHPRMLRWAAVVVLAGIMLIGIALLPTLLSRASHAGRVTLDTPPTANAVVLPRIIQQSTEIGHYVLSTTLPAVPSSLPAFEQVPLPLPTLEEARRLATQFGLQGEVFTATINSEFIMGGAKLPLFIIIDGPRRLTVDQDYIRYSDQRVRTTSWPSQSGVTLNAFPPEQVQRVAEAFAIHVGNTGILLEKFEPSKNSAFLTFASVLSGTPAATPYTDVGLRVEVGISGTEPAVGSAWIPRIAFQPANTVTNIIDPMTAYSRLVAGTHVLGSHRSGNESRYSPRWTQQYRDGQWASIEGLPQSMMPLAEAGSPAPQPRVEIREIRLDLSALSTTTTLSEPVWAAGVMRAAPDGELVLHVEQWERGGMPIGTGVTGAIEISGTVDGAPFALLRRPDGEAYFLPNAPDDLPNGIVVGGFLRSTERRVNGYTVAAWESLEQQEAAIAPISTTNPPPAPTLQPTLIPAVTMEAAPAGSAPQMSVSIGAPSGSGEITTPPMTADGHVEALEGWLQASLVQDEQGQTKRVEAFLSSTPITGTRWFAVLSGPLDVLSNLAQRDGTRVRIWGKVLSAEVGSTARIEVTRFERVDPTEEVRAWLGKLVTVTAEGQTIVALEDNAGERFALATTLQSPRAAESMGDMLNQWFIVEGVLRPERWAGLRIIQDQGARMSRNDPAELQAYRIDRPQIIQETTSNEVGTVERVELIYLANPLSRRLLPDGTLSLPDALNMQVLPAWRFSGHTSNGMSFETLVDARATPAP